MLTRKQHDLLMFIRDRIDETGVSPSFEEMKEALDLKSKSGVHRLVSALEERGFVRRLKHRARALEILRMPEAALPEFRSQGYRPNRPGMLSGTVVQQQNNAVPIPLYGAIAAGTPIEALADSGRTVDVPSTMLGSGEFYALTIEGESMIEAGILDGDIAIIKRCDSAENGAVIVALVDDNEATLKRLRSKGKSVALEPANKEYSTQVYGADRVKIQGRLAGLMRMY